MDTLKDYWEEISTKFKNDSKFKLLVILGFAAFAFIISLFSFGDKKPFKLNKVQTKAKSMFVSSNSAQELTDQKLEKSYKALQTQAKETEKKSNQLFNEWKTEKEGMRKDYADIKQEMAQIRRQMELMSSQQPDRPQYTSPTNHLPAKHNGTQNNKAGSIDNAPELAQQNIPVLPQQVRRLNNNIISSPKLRGSGLRIVSQRQETLVQSDGSTTTELKGTALERQIAIESNELSKTPTEEKEQPFWLPAGSMITGVFITGLNASTSPGATSEPEPVNIRITEDVIMPGGYTVDLKGCTIIGGAIGSLKDNRAKVRSELISCVREDGKAIEVNLMAYASGSDGLEGVHGKRVDLAGPIVATSILAGAAGGFSDSIKPQQIPSLQTSTSGDTLFQTPNVKDVTGLAALNGLGNSLTRAEDYLMDIADSMMPYIEVQAGRSVDLTTQKGVYLKIKS